MTKILFVNVVNESRKRRMEKHISNLGTGYIASYLQKYGNFNDTTIIEAGQNLDQKFLEDVAIVGISAVTQNFNIAKQVASKVRAHTNALVMVGGHHITALPNNLTEDMDVAVLGEGEQTALEIVQGHDFSKIRGIAYREDGKLRVTPKRELIKPLDKIPFPARDLMRLGSHHIISMYSSRGCPYRCVFCSSAHFWHSTRFFSADYVISEVSEILAKYCPKQINFSDDLFIADLKRLRKIAGKIRAKGFNREIEFRCNVRANLVNDEVASLLKSINVQKVNMGAESGSNRVLQYLKGNSVTVEQNEKAIHTLKKHGLNVNASFIIGSPTETRKDIMQTYKFIERSNLDGGQTFVMLPLPGTAVWEYGVQRGWLNDFMDWNNFEFYFEDNENRVVASDLLTREELLEILFKFKKLWRKRRRAYLLKQAFKHPRRILPYICRSLRDGFKDEDF